MRNRIVRRGGARRLGVPIGVFLLATVLVAWWALSQGVDPGPAAGANSASGGAPVSGDGSVTLPELTGATPEKARVLTRGAAVRRAAVWAATAARKTPSVSGPAVGRISTRTPEGTDNIVVALEERPDENGQLWVRVRLASRPNGKIGWVPRVTLGPYETLHTRLVVDRKRFRLTLWRGDRRVFRAPVGIGRPGAPTPAGRFYIRNELTKYANPFYGPIAFGTSATSPTLTEWPAGGFVGIHGTNQPELIPGRISHGCIRMRNADIVRLAHMMQPGTPLQII